MLRIAAELAEPSDVPRRQFGAVLVHNKTIISSGANSTKTHPKQSMLSRHREIGKKDRSFVHAEISCLSKFRGPVAGSVLYVARIDSNGDYRMARLCGGCMAEIVDRGIKTIVYSTDNGYAVERVVI